ncbi:outer membrane homotrimeric porin [Desulfovibrio sp. ZJ200]|uniref:outer membrane homotrimeric porin n=1 Tax=Desulfovibrio sp. ZJ200 TaxID=2709792 RepID=UPI0013EA7404|nr:outer membrane homotrimeric porin [Desulfovibrio sp. ZJ200]
MKKIATLLLAAGLVFGASTGASAIDFKAKGQWIMSFDYGQNGGFTGGNGMTGFNQATRRGSNEDEFEARQRVRLQLDAVASEALSGTVYFEIGDQIWGQAGDNKGGALGADGNNVIEVKRAYIDWMVPQTDLKVRMGIQGIALPSFTTGSNVMNDDVAGVVLSYKFNDNVALTALWARPFNDNFGGWNNNGVTEDRNYMDNVDMFSLILPLTFEGVKVTPWAMYAGIGPNAFRSNNDYFGSTPGASSQYYRAGMVPAGGALHKDGTPVTGKKLSSYGDAWWAGLTGEVTAWDPFRLAWDFNYGGVQYDDSHWNRQGWLASLLFEYKLDWGIPGLYGWYASGDDDDPSNGSERMPSVSTGNNNNGFSNFAFNGNPYIARDAILSYNMTGTWGIGARVKDVSFVEDLKHTLRVNYIGGTNDPKMAKYIVGRGYEGFAPTGRGIVGPNMQAVGMDPLYMTTDDSALEIGLTNTYQMYENFTVMLDAAYLATWLDNSKSVWGHSEMNGRSDQVRDPWNVNLSFVYSF